jgi:hypothetical protein
MSTCRLIALDIDDLTVISAHLQNATVRVGDVHWRPSERRVAILAARVEREASSGPGDDIGDFCRAAVLRFDQVRACKAHAIAPETADRELELLAVDFVASNGPAGFVTLYFSDNATLRLEVDCLECELSDLV